MAFNQVYVNKKLCPRVILKRLSLSLTHPYHCTKCPQRFHKIYEATAHYLSSHQNSNDLPKEEIQIETKIDVKPHKCMGYEPCSAEFKQRIFLRRHITAVHEKIKPHKCPTCELAFSQRSDLKRHITTVHEGFKPYQCNDCGNSFKLKQHLRGHISAVHEKIRPYLCSMCNKAFAKKGNLSGHVSSVHEGKNLMNAKFVIKDL